MTDKLMPLRFLLVSPLAMVGLFFFAVYFSFRNGKYGDTFLIYPMAATFGLASGITNTLWNWIGGTFVYWELPPTRDPEDGTFSIFFTNRMKVRLMSGKDDPMTRWFIWAIAQYDGHWRDDWDGYGESPYGKG